MDLNKTRQFSRRSVPDVLLANKIKDLDLLFSLKNIYNKIANTSLWKLSPSISLCLFSSWQRLLVFFTLLACFCWRLSPILHPWGTPLVSEWWSKVTCNLSRLLLVRFVSRLCRLASRCGDGVTCNGGPPCMRCLNLLRKNKHIYCCPSKRCSTLHIMTKTSVFLLMW